MPETALLPYAVKRLADDVWEVAGVGGLSLDEAVGLCEKLDEIRDFDWDFDTYGEARDGLQALRIGDSLTVTYPEQDDDE